MVEKRRLPAHILFFGVFLLILTACGDGGSSVSSTNTAPTAKPKLLSKQVLTFPNVGIADSASLDPALANDPNTELIVDMVYSGLVKFDANLNVAPDQAAWDISPDNTTYTFYLKSGIAFSDGTPVTAQTYVYSLTRALLPEVASPNASLFAGVIVGATAMMEGKTKVLAGVKALNALTLQIRLTQPTPYFLQMLTNSLYYPVNQQLVELYGQSDWPNHVVGTGVGTGPFMIEEWDHSVKMVLVPNPYYYGNRTQLTQVNMIFEQDPSIAYQTYRAGQDDFVWNIAPSDQPFAKGLSGFVRTSQLETDALFFNNKMPPFDNPVIRQAFAYATDKVSLAHTILNDSVIPAPTIIPPGMSGYEENYAGIPYNTDKAKQLLQSVYADVSSVPPITFSYSSAQITSQEAMALQQMWQNALGIDITLLPVEPNAYNNELARHQVQFGFTQWNADFPDPYDCLYLNLLSTATNNVGLWSNAIFDQTVMLAEKASNDLRLQLYNQAERIAVEDVGWLPLDHQSLAAIIPSWVHGVSLNANGLYFGDWSDVYVLQH
jgi:oligopeptide transport system substrate-binding protein